MHSYSSLGLETTFRLTNHQERDPFILVLIDGDGMIFEDYLVKKGEIGGKEAAAALWAATRDYIHQIIPGLSPDFKIVARIYANLKGLGETCHRAAMLENPATIEHFARGFTGSKHLFDFIDVGIGKDRADDKISGILQLNLLFPNSSDEIQRFLSFIYTTVIADMCYLAAPMITVMLESWKISPINL